MFSITYSLHAGTTITSILRMQRCVCVLFFFFCLAFHSGTCSIREWREFHGKKTIINFRNGIKMSLGKWDIVVV